MLEGHKGTVGPEIIVHDTDRELLSSWKSLKLAMLSSVNKIRDNNQKPNAQKFNVNIKPFNLFLNKFCSLLFTVDT